MKIAIAADFHINKDNRFEDMSDTLERLVEKVIKLKTDHFVFLGDGFLNNRPAPMEMALFRKTILSILEANISVVIITGNHDYPESDMFQGMHCFTEFEDWIVHNGDKENISVYDVPAVLDFKSFGGIFVPHIPRKVIGNGTYEEAFELAIKNTMDKYKCTDIKKWILFSHVYIKEAVIGAGDLIINNSRGVSMDVLNRAGIELAFAGDIHKSQRIVKGKSILYYSGSLQRIDFGESSDPKGFVTFNSDTDEVEFIQLNTRNMEEVVMDLVNPGFIKSTTRGDTRTTERSEVEIDNCLKYIAEALEAKREQLKDAIVKVKVICTKEQKAQIGDCDEKLNNLLLKELSVHSVKSISYEITDKVSVRNAEINESLGPVAALNKFLGMQEYKPDTAQQIRIAGEKIIKG